MFRKIMVPIDLSQAKGLERAIGVATDLARLYSSSVHFVAVTGAEPGSVAHNPAEFTAKLEALAAHWAQTSGVEVVAKTILSHDVAIELDLRLRQTAQELDADLIVVGSHVPGFADLFFGSHGASLASNASISVFVVR